MYTVYAVDPGYSLKKSLDLWKLKNGEHNYPGHVLYGVNHLNRGDVKLLLNDCDISCQPGIIGRLFYEFHIVVFYMRHKKSIDLIYLPLINCGTLLCMAKHMGLVKAPVAGLVHGISKGKGKRALYDFYFKALELIVFISEPVYMEFQNTFSKYRHKASCIPLMPEYESIPKEEPVKDIDVISIGKTYREYDTLLKAVQGTDIRCHIVDNVKLQNISGNISVQTDRIDYNTCRRLYHRSKINLVAVKEANGIFGLTSILDSFTMNIPVIVTGTKYLSVPIEELEIGIIVPQNDSFAMKQAIDKLLHDADFYHKCKLNLERLTAGGFNTFCFSDKLYQLFCGIMGVE